MTFRYLDLHTPTPFERVRARDTRARASARERALRKNGSPGLSAPLSHALPALPLSSRSFYSPFRGPPSSFSSFFLRRPPLVQFLIRAFRMREGRAARVRFILLE